MQIYKIVDENHDTIATSENREQVTKDALMNMKPGEKYRLVEVRTIAEVGLTLEVTDVGEPPKKKRTRRSKREIEAAKKVEETLEKEPLQDLEEKEPEEHSEGGVTTTSVEDAPMEDTTIREPTGTPADILTDAEPKKEEVKETEEESDDDALDSFNDDPLGDEEEEEEDYGTDEAIEQQMEEEDLFKD